MTTKYVDAFHFDRMLPRQKVETWNIDTSNNMFNDKLTLLPFFQVDNPMFENLSSRAVHNTFEYIYYKFRKGLFVSIIDGKVRAVVSFLNDKYRNEWSHLIAVDPSKYGSIQDLLDRASNLAGYTKTQKHIPLDEWRANDAMFRYEKRVNNEKDTNLEVFKDMFEVLCAERDIPDIEFFVNKKDYPLLKNDGTEPYDNLFGTKYQQLLSRAYNEYSPILSGSITENFADLLIPTYEDWARARYQNDGTRLPDDFKRYPNISIKNNWQTKKEMAVFRGSSTGSGVTPETNQRLKALELSEQYPSHLDVGIVKWNTRPRKHISSKFLETIERQKYDTVEPMSLQEQADSYKYILDLEGHVAAYRLSYELSCGSVVILADSRWKMWYSEYIKPFVHYVPVKWDLSDLIEKIEWCRANDDECMRIASNAKKFYDKYLCLDGLLDFMQGLFVETARMIGGYIWLPDLLELSITDELAYLLNTRPDNDVYSYPVHNNPRCIGRLDACAKACVSAIGKMEFIKPIFFDDELKVDCMRTNGFYIARKTALNADKKREHIHEAYLGKKVINMLVSRCPHFAYVYGENIENGEIYTEYISGPTLKQWITSQAYNEPDLVDILIQVSLALAVAQTYCSFIHYDMVADNIIVQNVGSQKIPFDYNVGKKRPVRFASKYVPVIIDFGKSRAVVHEESNGLMDRGYLNLFQNSSKSLDIMSLVYSVLDVLRGTDHKTRILSNFITAFKLPAKQPDVVDYVNRNILKFTPLNFVEFTRHHGIVDVTDKFNQKMLKGYVVVEELTMKYGDRNMAIKEAISRLYRQSVPSSNNTVVDVIIRLMLSRRISELDELVPPQLQNYYDTIRNRIMSTGEKQVSNEIVMDFPDIVNGYLGMDAYLTPNEILSFKIDDMQFTQEDWMTILIVCSESAIYDQNLDIFGTFDISSFDYLNEIASHNTFNWIYNNKIVWNLLDKVKEEEKLLFNMEK